MRKNSNELSNSFFYKGTKKESSKTRGEKLMSPLLNCAAIDHLEWKCTGRWQMRTRYDTHFFHKIARTNFKKFLDLKLFWFWWVCCVHQRTRDDTWNYFPIFLFQVAWVRVDTQTILTIHTHVITRSHRIGLSHTDSYTWSLHIRNVKETDRGFYMCQINTGNKHIVPIVFIDLLHCSSFFSHFVQNGIRILIWWRH